MIPYAIPIQGQIKSLLLINDKPLYEKRQPCSHDFIIERRLKYKIEVCKHCGLLGKKYETL